MFIDGTGLTGLGLGSDGDGLTATGIPILGAKPGIANDPNHIRNMYCLQEILNYCNVQCHHVSLLFC